MPVIFQLDHYGQIMTALSVIYALNLCVIITLVEAGYISIIVGWARILV